MRTGVSDVRRVEVDPPRRRRLPIVGLVAAPCLAVVVYWCLPAEFVNEAGNVRHFSVDGRLSLAVMVWMGIWWLSEAVSVEATALLPLALFPLVGITSMSDAAAPYASPLIFLFMGGFLLAIAMQGQGLDRRIALLTLRLVGSRPVNLIGGFMVATAVMSSCVSNTATVAMMIPIGLGITRMADEHYELEAQRRRFKVALMLGIAYAASIGGLATLIGSPPNGFLAQYAADNLGVRVTFLDWLVVGLPLTIVLLPTAWWLLTRWLFPLETDDLEGGAHQIRRQWNELGPMHKGEWVVFSVFVFTVAAWIGRPLLIRLFPQLTDAGIAIAAGLALFAIPVGWKRSDRVLTWNDAKHLPWGVLVLFGGGLSLASAVGDHGVGEFVGSLAGSISFMPAAVIVVAITGGMVFLTELTSNTASAATLVPILVAISPSMGLEPHELAVPATLAASCAFMLPVATPPNAIVFGSGHVTMGEMMRAGIWMNVIATAAITIVIYGLVLRFVTV